MRIRVFGEKLRVENENESYEGNNEIEIENEKRIFKNGSLIKTLCIFLTIHIKIFIIEAS